MADLDMDTLLQSIFDSDELNTWKPSEKIQLVNKELDKLKADMRNFLSDSDYDIGAVLKESTELCAESGALVQEMETCCETIERETMVDILEAIESQNRLTKEVEIVYYSISLIYDIVQCGNYVKDYESGRQDHSFNRAVEAVYDLLQYIENPTDGFKTLDFYTSTKRKSETILENLIRDLYIVWNRMIAYSIQGDSDRSNVTITFNFEDMMTVVDVLNALDKCKMLKGKINEFSQFLLKEVLDPMIHYDCSVFAETDELMTVTINHGEPMTPPFEAVIANLRSLFHFLSNKLNIEFDCHFTLMTLIGQTIAVEFCDILTKGCLLHTIPNNLNDLENYGIITSQIEDFQRFLDMIKFIDKKKYSLLDYMKDIEVLFADKSSEYYLETAREIMLKDLSVTMSIGVESIPDEEQATSSPTLDKSIEDALHIFHETIPKSLFYFPRCMISKSAQELLDLINTMMEQSVECTDVVCKKLYNTTRLIFELYDAVVPYHHENYLQTIPQYVALFHNNCMFLAHHLQTVGANWTVLMLNRPKEYPIGFVDLALQLRALGARHLATHMQQQRKQILDNIRSSDLNCIMMKDVLGDNAEAAVRQCLRQLQLLKNVWIGVFPSNVFARLMATLVGMFASELVHRVCSAEDISAEMGAQLADMCTLVGQKGPLLFQKPSDIESVAGWGKLLSLAGVLRGSLAAVEAGWGAGAGPLAAHWRAAELRALVRALFQNTNQRAALLHRIK